MKELYIDSGITQSRAVVIDNDKIVDIYVENHYDSNLSGNIYKARIENIVSGLNACFINIGDGKNAILHIEESDSIENYKRGQEIIVQVVREGIGDKGPRVSRNISIPGKNIVLLPGVHAINISQKITDAEKRQNLKDIAMETYNGMDGMIIRTEAEYEDPEIIKNEYKELSSIWQDIYSNSRYLKAPCILYNTRSFYHYVLREYAKKDIDKICINRINDEKLVNSILKSMNSHLYNKVNANEYDLNWLNIIQREMDKSGEKIVNLPSGGYIVIDRAEAFTIIDVNTGGYIGTLNKENTTYITNIEACKEIFNVVKIRNISGIILIDFIDMESKENKINVIKALTDEFKSDRVTNRIYGFTNLGILEMSRSKKGKRLEDIIGIENNKKTDMTPFVLKTIENECLKRKTYYNTASFDIFINDEIGDIINQKFPFFIDKMKSIYDIKINFIKTSGIDKFYLADSDNKNNYETIKLEIGDKKYFGKVINIDEGNGKRIKIELDII